MTTGSSLRRLRRRVLDRLPTPLLQRARRLIRRPRWGNLRRMRPISAKCGFDRGTPIDRYYTEQFLARHADAIRGIVGEVAEDSLSRRFGGLAVERVEIIDIDADNPSATIVADLAADDALEADTFDCLIVCQTVQYIADPAAAVAQCASALRPGGTLLLAAPGLTPHDAIESDDADHWRFWPAGVRHLLSAAFPGSTIEIWSPGNLTVATAFLHGLSAEDLSPEELATVDPRYPVVTLARVTTA